jgi:hypothetical protein
LNPPDLGAAQRTLWPLLTPGSLSRARSPRVRTCTFDPCRQALPDTSFGDDWISRSLARSSPVFGLTACSCSCGRVLATPFFQLGLAASTLGFATLLVTLRGYLLSGNKYMPMSGTLGRNSGAYCAVADPISRQAAEYGASAYSALRNSLEIGITVVASRLSRRLPATSFCF